MSHTDRRSQFSDAKVAAFCACQHVPLHGCQRSCYNHASAETFWSTFKHEYFCRYKLHDIDRITGPALPCTSTFYNHERPCTKAANLSPIGYELALARSQQVG